jgi:uncharacterized protein involved in cysteine biosynthesis
MEQIKNAPISGISEIKHGFTVLKSNPKFWKFCYIPIAISFVLSVPALYFFGDIFDLFRQFLPTWEPVQDKVEEGFLADLWDSISYTGTVFFSWIFDVLVFLLTLIILLLFFIITLKILSSPFNDALSENVEALLLGENTDIELPNILDSIQIALKTEGQRILIFISIFIPLNLMAIFLPGLGHTIITILLAIYSAYWLCYDAMSYSMDRNLWTLKKRFSFLIKYPIQNLFFGFAMYLFALIPVVNLFFMPLFVVSGTILFQKEKTSLENP